jgi:hypothetical protein
MTYIQNTHRFRGFKFTFADWFKFSLIEEMTYEIDVRIQENFPNNDARHDLKPRLLGYVWLGHCFKATLPYLLLIRSI